jgi:mono/diheme cytochrome c family protein
MRKKLMIPVLLCAGMIACTFKKELDELPASPGGGPAITCDTTAVKYSGRVSAILSANCYSCHAAAVANSAGGGNMLDSYTRLTPYINSGLLLNVILHTNGYDPMPKNAAKLSDCDIATIRTWIRNGAPNN